MDRQLLKTFVVVAVMGTTGLLAWIATMASAPRYSRYPNEDMGNSAFYLVLLGVAAVGGYLIPDRAATVGATLGLPGTLLSPWTAPRGDNDGLWLLIVPILVFFTFMLIGVAIFAGFVRRRGGSRTARSTVHWRRAPFEQVVAGALVRLGRASPGDAAGS